MRLRRLVIPFVLLLAAAGRLTLAQVDAVASVGMTVEDMDRSVDFYTRVLDFTKVGDTEVAGKEYDKLFGVFGVRARIVTLRLGEETIELTQFLTPRGRAVPRDSRSNDRWFQHIAIVTPDIDRVYQRLRENKVRHASTGPQTLPSWNPKAGGIKAFYFFDPDDHVLEIIQFPPGKGDPRWQRPSDQLLLGIDHTAIVVADTEKSLAFYRDVLGMKIAGTSENWGDEQEQLNHVEGARVRITTMKAARGPGVEFLEYLSPRDGRDFPHDAKPIDLFHWHTIVVASEPDELARALHRDPTTLPSESPYAGESFLSRDPDGHSVLITD